MNQPNKTRLLRMTLMVITGVGLMWVYYSGVFASNQESSNSVIETPQSPTNEEITKALCKKLLDIHLIHIILLVKISDTKAKTLQY